MISKRLPFIPVLVGGILLATPLSALGAEDPTLVATTPRPVISEIVASEAARLRSFPATIVAVTETTLAFQTPGRIESRPANLGDRVKKGDVLATLDQVTLQQDVDAAQAALRAAEAEADLASKSFDRARELSDRGVASKAQLEGALAQRDATAAKLRAAQADLSRAEDAARFGKLVAPADGIVTAVEAEPGAVVSTGTAVLKLAVDGGREAIIDVPDDILAVIRSASGFTIQPRTDNGPPVKGTLRLIEPVANNSTRSHRLRIALEDGGKGLRLGSLVTARLDVSEKPTLSLPAEAILDEDGAHAVRRIGAGRKIETVPVTPGAAVGDRVIITSGVEEGDEVLIRGIHSVKDGETVGARIEP